MKDVPSDLLRECVDTIKKSFADLLRTNDDRSLEIEARLGIILDRRTNTRIDLGATHPIIFSSQKPEFYFQSGVSQSFFESVTQSLSSLDSEHFEEIVIIKNKIRAIYSEGKRTFMKKVRLRTFEIHFPGCQYDVRVSFSKEEMLSTEKNAGALSRKDVGFRRERDRLSMSTSFYRFDLTSIKVPEKFIYEIEVEIMDFAFDRNEFFNILENIAG